MNAAALAMPIIAVAPVAVAAARLPVRITITLLSALSLVGLWKFGPVAGELTVANAPLWIVAALVAFRAGRIPSTDNAISETELDGLRGRRSDLREVVAAAERDEQRALQTYSAAKSLAESVTLEEMGPRLASAVQRMFNSFEFMLYGLEAGKPVFLQRRGAWKREPPLEKFPSTPAVVRPPAVQEIVPVLYIPIVALDATVSGGLFVKVTPDAEKEPEFLRIAAELGPQLGMALAKAQIFGQMERQSRQDGLTGTMRRQAFLERLAEEFKRAAVFKTSFSILMVDIDHFKAINDTRGHAAGDAVLTRIGRLLNEAVYETDAVGRYGGEEFIILLPRSEQAGVLRKAEALRKRIEMENISTGFGSIQVTVSVGIARYPQAGKTADDVIGAADKALYRAKEGGRNRVVEG